MANNLVSIKAEDIKAVGNRVIVSDMEFGEQVTKGGIILRSDDGTTRGIYPRWGRVFRKVQRTAIRMNKANGFL